MGDEEKRKRMLVGGDDDDAMNPWGQVPQHCLEESYIYTFLYQKEDGIEDGIEIDTSGFK
jgi:hypothetical protein